MPRHPFPQAVVDRIVNFVSNDPFFLWQRKIRLKRLALVSRAFRAPAQDQMFSELLFVASKQSGFRDHIRFLQTSPHICAYIRILTIQGEKAGYAESVTCISAQSVRFLITMLPNLHDLHIHRLMLFTPTVPEISKPTMLPQPTAALNQLSLRWIGNGSPTPLPELVSILELFNSVDRLEIDDWYLPDSEFDIYDGHYLDMLPTRFGLLQVKHYNVWSSKPTAPLHQLLRRMIDPNELVFLDAFCHTQEEIDAVALFTRNTSVTAIKYSISCFEFDEPYDFHSLWVDITGTGRPTDLTDVIITGPMALSSSDDSDGSLIEQWLACASFIQALPPTVERLKVNSRSSHTDDLSFWDILNTVDWKELDRNLAARAALREIEFYFTPLHEDGDEDDDVVNELMNAPDELDEDVVEEQTGKFVEYLATRLSQIHKDGSKSIICKLISIRELGI